MNFFTIEKATGKITSVSSYPQAAPDEYLVRQVKEGELQKFYAGFSKLDSETDELVTPNITSQVALRAELVKSATKQLNALAIEAGYVDLNDAISFSTSKSKERKADAERLIKLRDSARDEIDALVSKLGPKVDISLTDALAQLTPLK